MMLLVYRRISLFTHYYYYYCYHYFVLHGLPSKSVIHYRDDIL